MGKMPLAGLIGACSLGMLLTGCNCCNKRASYAGGKAETSMGLLGGSPRSRNQSTTIPAPLDDTAGKSLGSPSAVGSSTDFVPRGSSASSGGSSAVGMTTPSSSGNMTPLSRSSALPLNTSPPSPLSANPTNPSSFSSSMSKGNSASSLSTGSGGTYLSSSPIQQAGYKVSDSSGSKAPPYSSADSDGTPHLPSKGPSRVIPAPPPTTDSYISTTSDKTSSTATKNSTSSKASQRPASSSSSSPPPPPTDDNTSLLSDPPPSVNMKPNSNLSGSGTSTSTSSSNSLTGPGYLK